MLEITSAIKQMPKSKTPGKDQIIAEMIDSRDPTYLKILYKIFNLCWDTNTFPDKWQEVITIPIYKKGNKTNPLNYRPISLISIVTKLYMKNIQTRL